MWVLSWETVGGVGAPEAVAEALQSLGCKEREKHERKDPGGPATFGALTQRCECEAEAAVLGCLRRDACRAGSTECGGCTNKIERTHLPLSSAEEGFVVTAGATPDCLPAGLGLLPPAVRSKQ